MKQTKSLHHLGIYLRNKSQSRERDLKETKVQSKIVNQDSQEMKVQFKGILNHPPWNQNQEIVITIKNHLIILMILVHSYLLIIII